MFRENVLTKDSIIDLIATTMIPVAVDRWKADNRRTEEAKFLQPFLKKHPPQGSPCIYSPDGKVLGGFRGFGDMERKTKKLIEKALQRFGPVKRREKEAVETQPYRGRGVRPDGSVQLAECVRPTPASLAHLNTRTPVISSVIYSKREFRAFSPLRFAVGSRWELPERVARKLARISSPLCYQHAPRPEWVSAVRVTGEITHIEDGVAKIRYKGSIASTHRVRGRTVSSQEASFTGEGVYERSSERLQSVLLVGCGTLRWPESPQKRIDFDLLVEWQIDTVESLRREPRD